MSVKQLIEKYEAEAINIQEKITTLNERATLVETMAKELKSFVGETRKPAQKVATPAKKARAPRAKGKMTAREAILRAVSTAEGPLIVREIITAASSLSGGAETSIRTQINLLAKKGELRQVPHTGRGFRYGVATPAAPAPVADEMKSQEGAE